MEPKKKKKIFLSILALTWGKSCHINFFRFIIGRPILSHAPINNLHPIGIEISLTQLLQKSQCVRVWGNPVGMVTFMGRRKRIHAWGIHFFLWGDPFFLWGIHFLFGGDPFLSIFHELYELWDLSMFQYHQISMFQYHGNRFLRVPLKVPFGVPSKGTLKWELIKIWGTLKKELWKFGELWKGNSLKFWGTLKKELWKFWRFKWYLRTLKRELSQILGNSEKGTLKIWGTLKKELWKCGELWKKELWKFGELWKGTLKIWGTLKGELSPTLQVFFFFFFFWR